MDKTIYIDLDGTILDISEKYYRVYSDLGGKMDKSEYWRLKRSGYPIEGNSPKRVSMLESREYIKYDVLFVDAVKTLACFSSLVLVTLRRDYTVLKLQLEDLGILGLFSAVLTGSNKFNILNPVLLGESILVGDSPSDILAARELKIQSIAVSTGVRNCSVLLEYKPDSLIDNISALPKAIEDELYVAKR